MTFIVLPPYRFLSPPYLRLPPLSLVSFDASRSLPFFSVLLLCTALFCNVYLSLFAPRPQKALTSKFFAAPVLALAATTSFCLVSALTSEFEPGSV